MKKLAKSPISKQRKNLPHFHPIVSIVTLVIGILGTLLVTRVLAQTANNTIYACVNKNTGFFRMVTATTTCRQDETAIQWNTQGPQGQPGPAGTSNPVFSCSYCYLIPVADKFKGKDFSYAQMWRSTFHGADLSGTIFKGANMSNMDFTNTNLTSADFSNSNYDSWGDISGDFSSANLTNVNFTNSIVMANFNNANLQNANFTNSNLRNSSNMSSATVTGVIWNNTICPDGTNSDNNGNTCVGHF